MLCACCEYVFSDHVRAPSPETIYHGSPGRRCGIFCFDPVTQRTLLVQSYGRHWGFPKGCQESHEGVLECALRETREETGVEVFPKAVRSIVFDQDRYTIFFVIYHPRYVILSQYFRPHEGDSTGFAWVRLECLRRAHPSLLNFHIRAILRRIRWISNTRVSLAVRCLHCSAPIYLNLIRGFLPQCSCMR